MLQGIPHFSCEYFGQNNTAEVEDSLEPEIDSDNKSVEESLKILRPKYLVALGII